MEEKPKFSKDLKDLEERLFQKANSEEEKAKADIDKKIESFHTKLINADSTNLVSNKKDWLEKEMRRSLYDKYVATHANSAKLVIESLRETMDKFVHYETDMRRAQEKIKKLSHTELMDEHLQVYRSIEDDKKLVRK